MEIDWRQEVNEATAVKMVCDICAGECATAVYADHRLLCPQCAASAGLHGREVSYEKVLHNMLQQVREHLNQWACVLEDLAFRHDRPVASVGDAEPPANWRWLSKHYGSVEEHYLHLHRIFRREGYPIPSPGWRSAYVERVVNCGYPSRLGD
ncbi:MAG: hypothetical protein ACYC1C_21575 [Chloroflexota bacterium]